MKYFSILILLFFLSCTSQWNLAKKFEKDKRYLIDELTKMNSSDQKIRLILKDLDKNDTQYRFKRDSLWKIQKKIDNKNTNRLIEITKKYGFPNPDRLNEPIGVWVIFQHTPNKYKEEVKNLILIEHKKGRLFDNEFHMIMWHLNGRKGIPALKGIKINDLRENK